MIRTARADDHAALCSLFDELDALHRRAVEVDNLVVRERWRGRGIGRGLMAASLAWARGQQASHLEVSVHDFNEAARRFYAAAGFALSIHRLMRAA